MATLKTEQQIADALDELASLREEIENTDDDYRKMYDSITKPIKEKLDKIAKVRDKAQKPLLEEAKELEDAIRTAVGKFGRSIEGSELTGTYVRPKEKWDGKKLEGYSIVHPEILQARLVEDYGSCQIRKNKKEN